MDRDRVANFAEIVRALICSYAEIKPSFGEIEVETILDDKSGHYELSWVGWDGSQRVDGPVIHIDLRNGKVWIQHNGTDQDIAEELVLAGVPRDHIVIGFHPAHKRPLTAYAVS